MALPGPAPPIYPFSTPSFTPPLAQPSSEGLAFDVDLASRWRERKQQRASTASLTMSASQGSLGMSASQGSLGMRASQASLGRSQTLAKLDGFGYAINASTTPYKWKAIKALPPLRLDSSAHLAGALRPGNVGERRDRKSKFNQLATWLSRQDSAVGFELNQRTPSMKALRASASAAGLAPATPASVNEGASVSGDRTSTPAVDTYAEANRQKELRSVNRQKLKSSAFVKGASDALNSRFSDMFKAFQYVDLDRSGTLDNKEIRRALDLWNIPIDDVKLAELIEACDHDGDGQVDYKEFVDVLARDTVAPAAMGKRDMQAEQAMGVASLDKSFLGHSKATKAVGSIND